MVTFLGQPLDLVTTQTSVLQAVDGRTIQTLVLVLLSLLAVGRYARLLELQADGWAVSQAHADQQGQYVEALRKLSSYAEVDQVGWLHPSFAQRRDFLLRGRLGRSWLKGHLRRTELLLVLVPWTIALATVVWGAG